MKIERTRIHFFSDVFTAVAVLVLVYWCTKTVHQYGVSRQSSTKVGETFRQITQKLWATKTWDLDKLFSYILVFYSMSFSWLLPLDGFQFKFFVTWQWKRSINTGINVYCKLSYSIGSNSTLGNLRFFPVPFHRLNRW